MRQSLRSLSVDKVQKNGDLAGSQTLVRGLEIIDAVVQGTLTLDQLTTQVSLTRSTAYRIATTLVNHRYLKFSRGIGYALGPRLLELGFMASRQTSLGRVAHEHLMALAARTGDTAHLGILEGFRALYIDKVPGSRRIEISSRIGELQPLRSTGIGKALILDFGEAKWREYYEYEAQSGRGYVVDLPTWLNRMRDYAKKGCAFDLEENEDRIRCVAAPVRDAGGTIIGSISVSSAAQYMDDKRMRALVTEVKDAAARISEDLGFNPKSRGASRKAGRA